MASEAEKYDVRGKPYVLIGAHQRSFDERDLRLEVVEELRASRRNLFVSRVAFAAMLATGSVLAGVAATRSYQSDGGGLRLAAALLGLAGSMGARVAVKNFAMEVGCLRNTLDRFSSDAMD